MSLSQEEKLETPHVVSYSILAPPCVRPGRPSRLKRLSQNLNQLLARQRNWIGFHTAGLGGLLAQFGCVLALDAILSERRDFQRRYQFGHPSDAVIRGCAGCAGEQTSNLLVAIQSRAFGLALAERMKVGRQHVRQQRGAYCAVRSGKHPADRSGEPMHCP